MPKKQFFRHDAEFRLAPEVLMLRNKFGIQGYAVYLLLKELITRTEDFQMLFTDDSMAKTVLDIGIELPVITAVVNDLIQVRKLAIRQVSDVPYLYCPEIDIEMAPVIKARASAVARMRKLRTKPEKIKKSKRVKKPVQPKLIEVPEKKHALQVFIETKFPRIAKMDGKLTYKQAERIQENYPDGAFVKRILAAMANNKKLLSNYTSVYETFVNWAQSDWPRWLAGNRKAVAEPEDEQETRNYSKKL